MFANSTVRSLCSTARITLALLLSALVASPDLALAQEPITCGGTGWTPSTVKMDPPNAPSGYGVETFGAALNGSTLYILGGEQWINQVPTFQTKVLHKSAAAITNGNTTCWFTDNFWKDPNSPTEIVGYARDLCGVIYTSPSNGSYIYTVGGVYYDSKTVSPDGNYGFSTNWVWYTKINTNGSLVQPWTRAQSLPTPKGVGLQLHGTAIVTVAGNTYMYVIGGSTASEGNNTVSQHLSAATYYGMIDPITGNIATWKNGPPISSATNGLYKTCPVVDPATGTIYVAGGETFNGPNQPPATANVWYTTPTATNPFPAWSGPTQINPNNSATPVAAQAVAFTNRSIYLIGGDSTGQGGDWCTVLQGQVGSP